MVEEVASTEAVGAAEYIHFWAAGDLAKGQFHCSGCGCGVTVHSTLPQCPMCASTSWEQSPWSPFGRALAELEG